MSLLGKILNGPRFPLNAKLHKSNVLHIYNDFAIMLGVEVGTIVGSFLYVPDLYHKMICVFISAFTLMFVGVKCKLRDMDYWTAIGELERINAWGQNSLGIVRLINRYYITAEHQKVLAAALSTLAIPVDSTSTKAMFTDSKHKPLRFWNKGFFNAVFNPISLTN